MTRLSGQALLAAPPHPASGSRMLHVLAASHVLKICQVPTGNVTAGTLNDMVAAFPQPAEAVRMMGVPIGNLPILFEDVGVKELANILARFIFEGDAPWPVFYMPLNRMEHWASDPAAIAFLEYLHKNGLDLQLTVGGPQTWLRGHWVLLCDMRLRFQIGATAVEMDAVRALPPPA